MKATVQVRSRRTLAVAVLILFPLFCPSVAASFEIEIVDRVTLPEPVRRAMTQELDQIFAKSFARGALPLRISVTPPLAQSPGHTSTSDCLDRTRVNLWPRNGELFGLPSSTLGAFRLDYQGRGTTHVFFPAVVRTLVGRRGHYAQLPALVIGRALARVVAHEVIHSLSPRHPHAHYGIMDRALSKEVLLRPVPVVLDHDSGQEFLRRLTDCRPAERQAPWLFLSLTASVDRRMLAR